MTLSELILAVGDNNVAFQMLDKCTTAMNFGHKSGLRITFGTDQTLDLQTNMTQRVGIVMWLPRDKVQEISKKLNGAS